MFEFFFLYLKINVNIRVHHSICTCYETRVFNILLDQNQMLKYEHFIYLETWYNVLLHYGLLISEVIKMFEIFKKKN